MGIVGVLGNDRDPGGATTSVQQVSVVATAAVIVRLTLLCLPLLPLGLLGVQLIVPGVLNKIVRPAAEWLSTCKNYFQG